VPRALAAELERLCDTLRVATSRELARHNGAALLAVVGEGAGDATFALDRPCERAIERWQRELARRAPLSVLSEESGWTHLAPGRRGGVRELDTFDHGGWRIVIDPIDGTRNLAAGLRSAWTAIAVAPSGATRPSQLDVTAGLLSELPTPLMGRFRRLSSLGREPRVALHDAADGRVLRRAGLRAPRGFDPRAPGYWSFFRYTPAQRPWLAALEARFFARMEREHGLVLRHAFDDQYISNAGQLALLALGTYRMIVDARAHVAEHAGIAGTTSKPYDVAGAIAVARAAGCVVTAPDGAGLDFMLDATTPVGFAGYANARVARAAAPLLAAELGHGLAGRQRLALRP
jgi:fructose-1,6-bisphosphatase/inositol monophosphatase family enzyme